MQNLPVSGQASAFARFDIDMQYQSKQTPVWQQYFFWDLFGAGQEEIKMHRNFPIQIPAQLRMRHSLHVARMALKGAVGDLLSGLEPYLDDRVTTWSVETWHPEAGPIMGVL